MAPIMPVVMIVVVSNDGSTHNVYAESNAANDHDPLWVIDSCARLDMPFSMEMSSTYAG